MDLIVLESAGDHVLVFEVVVLVNSVLNVILVLEPCAIKVLVQVDVLNETWELMVSLDDCGLKI